MLLWILVTDLENCTDDAESKPLHLSEKEKTEQGGNHEKSIKIGRRGHKGSQQKCNKSSTGSWMHMLKDITPAFTNGSKAALVITHCNSGNALPSTLISVQLPEEINNKIR